MFTRPTVLATLALIASFLPQASSGQVLGAEPFTYANGSLAGKTGGSGFNRNSFTGTVTGTVSDWDTVFGSAASSLQGGKLVTSNSGFRREYNGPSEGEGTASDDTNDNHERSGAIRATGRLFYRFTLNRAAGNSTWCGVSSYEFGSERLFFGIPGNGAATDTIGIEEFGTNSGVSLGSVSLADGIAHTLVAVIDFDHQRLGLFVNPGPEKFWNPRDGTNNADVTRSYTGAGWSTAIRLASAGQATWDDLKIAREADAVGLQTLGSDDFTYSDGAIAGRTGGMGFNYNAFTGRITGTGSDWDASSGTPVVSNNQLVTDNDSGARREYNGPTEGTGDPTDDENDDHARSGAIRTTGQVFYRFTMNRAAGNGAWSGASSYAFGSERIFFGVPSGGGGTDTIGIDQTGFGTTLGSIRVTDGITHTFVAVIDYTNQLLGLFVNPGEEDFWNPADGSNSADVLRPYANFTTAGTSDWSTAVRLASGDQVTWDNLTISLNAAGAGLVTTIPDLDADGLPGYWETLHALDDNDDGSNGENPPGAKNGPNGPSGDPDGDGKTNAEEYAAGTNPQNSDSDEDGFSDSLEFALGSNPSNPASYPGADPQPGLMGVDHFNYPDGPINGRKAGTHWDVDNSTENDDFTGHTLSSSVWSGSAVVGDGVLITRDGTTARREYHGPGAEDEQSGAVAGEATQSSHVVYYRFQMTRRAGASWGGASSYDYGAERFLFGVPGAANPASGQREFAIHDLPGNQHAYSGIQPVDGQTYLLVSKINYDTNIASLYLDPDLSLPENANIPVASYSFATDYWSTALRLGSGGSGDVEWDDVRVASNWQALQGGPPVANNDSMTLSPGGQARLYVTSNDTGSVNPHTVVIVSQPANGTATVSSDGSVLYQHTDTPTTSDSFTYRISSSSDTSQSIATVEVTVSDAPRFDTNYVSLPAAPPATALMVENALPGITFDSPHDFCAVPGDSGKVFVTEGDGRVFLIPDITAAAPQKIQVLDITSQVNHDNNEFAMKSIAVHPNWAANGYLYVTYNSTSSTVRLSRFTCQTFPPYTAGSELVLIDQVNEGTFHNIGNCSFGADGYLYVGFGDEGTQNDGYDNSQHIDKDIWSCIARIDVDRKPENLIPNEDTDIPRIAGGSTGEAHFRIPADNPFVGATSFNGITIDPLSVRSEIYICGFRNPWQFSPEDLDGNGTVDEVWVADVGRSTREEVGAYTAGQNAGWAWREGSQNGIRSGQLINGAAEPAAVLTPPVWDYPHGGGAFEGKSITGGFIYRGTSLPELDGKYVFADFVSGNIWSLERTTTQPTVTRLGGEVAIVALMRSPAEDGILLLDRGNVGTNQGSGSIKRLKSGTTDGTFPQTLSRTNFFSNLADLTPNPGGVAYTPNLRFWSDFAEKSRWFLINDTADTVSFSPTGPWSYPQGMVFVKHFDYPTEWETFTRTIDGQAVTDRRPLAASPKVRLETRFLVRNATGAYGVSYRWNGTQTDASLAENNGETIPFGITIDNQPVPISWRIPSRSSCMTCHTPEAGHALSFNTPQLNRVGSVGPLGGNFISALSLAGYLQGFSENPANLPRHLRPDESAYSKEERVRSYLDVNCSYCHQAGGTGGGNWDGRSFLTLAQTGMINTPPVDDPIQPGDLIVIPGQVNHSILYNRLAAANGYSRMPPLASTETDLEGVQLLSDWIASEVSPHTTYAGWRLAYFGNNSSPIGSPDHDADGDGLTNRFEYLSHTDPHDAASTWKPVFGITDGQANYQFTGLPDRRILAHRSSNMTDWEIWPLSANDGIPLPSQSGKTLQAPVEAGKRFFRLSIEER
jgi:glucose/arabinose dehydrogenase